MVETADSTALHATKVTPRYEKNTRVLVMPANVSYSFRLCVKRTVDKNVVLICRMISQCEKCS